MSMKPLFGSICLAPLLSATAVAGEPIPLTVSAPEPSEPTLREELPSFDLAQLSYLQTGEMDIDGSNADLMLRSFEFRSFFLKPVTILDGLSFVPMIRYKQTNVDFNNLNNPFLHDEDLHKISLSTFFFKKFRNSPWFGVGYTNIDLSSDFQDIDSDAFTYDFALGVGYRISDTFTIAAGAAIIGVNSDSSIFPAINFDWKPNDSFQVGLYGPNFLARYTVNDAWNVSLRGLPNGGTWVYNNDLGQSRTLDITSIAVGLYTEHNIYGEFWLSAGVGYTFANEIEIRNNHGGNSTSRDMDSVPYGEIALGLRKW